MTTAISCFDSEGLWKVSAKSESWFPNQPTKRWVNFVRAGESDEISNFNGLFCLKGNLLQPKSFTGGSSCETEGRWKVSAKTELWFPIQLGLMENLYLAPHCFALYLCIVFHHINLAATHFNGRPPIPSQAMSCTTHYIYAPCTLLQFVLACCIYSPVALNFLPNSSMKYR